MTPNFRRVFFWGALGTLALPALAGADNFSLPAAQADLYSAECGGCHVAFPPQLLSAQQWRAVMGRLDSHYGTDATLEPARQAEVLALLEQHAGKGSAQAEPAPGEETRPRLTTSAWFKRKHHEVDRTLWSHPEVKTPANCGACHTRADEGSYREREIVMPGGGRWEEDDE